MLMKRILEVDFPRCSCPVRARVHVCCLSPTGDRPTTAIARSAAPANPMKAIVHCDYGFANLKLEDIEKPVPA